MTPPRDGAELVLIVEDDAETAQSLAEVLQLLGYDSDVVENGKLALEYLRNAPGRYCLVFLDVMMPVMDGWEFLTEQRSDATIGEIPVVIVSAVPNVETRARKTTAVGVLPKPIDPVKLEATLQQYC